MLFTLLYGGSDRFSPMRAVGSESRDMIQSSTDATKRVRFPPPADGDLVGGGNMLEDVRLGLDYVGMVSVRVKTVQDQKTECFQIRPKITENYIFSLFFKRIFFRET